ncbi:NADH:flavin oxidoreductase/NADH oxidase [Bacillus thuringiensis]|uniref:NADH:flavin oxidoreductase/NADH oxidase n=1 Tax=Bacillus thuringiensis TaxID=1428 RepID=UPI000BF5486A|nr:NADH:flavin oxidoreductase/NADH oxidase [Bacillus thuringiensis]PEY73212.1 NADPH dehydrogenase [Bacillus thuringiensis]
MENLFSPFKFKNLNLKNRIVMAPMCQYAVTTQDGIPNDWHFIHYTSRAVGGTGLITIEMTGIDKDGRITNNDLGLWSDKQIPFFSKIIGACKNEGASVSLQLAHAGRKAEDVAIPIAPSAIRFEGSKYKCPRELSTHEVKSIVQKFASATRRAVDAGVDAIELHAAHGYLIHQFQSPLTNKRKDKYGDDFAKFGVEVVEAVKSELPSSIPLIMRVSAVEYTKGGYDLNHSIEICKQYKKAGVEIFHISSGGEGSYPDDYPAHQVPFARAFKNELQVPVIAAGRLDSPQLADSVICNKDADLVAVGRGMLRDPYWALHATQSLNYKTEVPTQYMRAF